ncbi:MAG: threonylcarbamoyl-AMP synthase [Puniceicoccales bacterium]|nr:threonylcarbamoyl-AMP synthase [Puniceicoccales bacterium]
MGAEILVSSEVSIRRVVDALRSGEVVALPTETVYGLAAIISDDAALRKIFEVKARPLVDPLIVHVLDLSSLLNLVQISDDLFNGVYRLVDAFCPGPLTFLLRKRKSVSDIITAGKKTVAVRLPAHTIFREVLRQSGPLAAPSANPFGYLSPTCAAHVSASIGDKIPYILDGGTCTIGLESTILDLTGKHFAILRPGAITAEMIEDVLGKKIVPYRPLVSADPSAPGILKQHYSPRTRLRLFERSPEVEIPHFQENRALKTAILYLSREEAQSRKIIDEEKATVFWLSENGNLNEIAHNIFDLLQRLDSMNFDAIYCQIPQKIDIGIAINDRLIRAAAKF